MFYQVDSTQYKRLPAMDNVAARSNHGVCLVSVLLQLRLDANLTVTTIHVIEVPKAAHFDWFRGNA